MAVNFMLIGALATSILALIIVIVAMATDHWAEIPGTNVGLWRNCYDNGHCIVRGSGVPDTTKAAQAGIILAFISNLIATLTLALYTWLSKLQKFMKISSIVLLSFALLWNLIAVATFAVEFDTGLAWSWGMAIFAAVLEVVAIILTVLAGRSEYRRANTS